MPILLQMPNKTIMKYIVSLFFLLLGIANSLIAQDQSDFFKAVD